MQSSTFKKLAKTCLYKISLLFIILGEGYIVLILFIAIGIALLLTLLFQLPIILINFSKAKPQELHREKYFSDNKMHQALLN